MAEGSPNADPEAPSGAGLALTPEEFCDRARRLTGLDDFGSDDFRAGLERLHGSCTNDAALSHVGSASVSAHITMALVTRLRLVRLRKDQPAIFEQPLNDPLIVIGLPRSGTTFLHHLLCQAPDTRWLATWETLEPIADPNADFRRRFHARHLEMMMTFAPELADKHPVDLEAPDECMYLLDPSFVSLSFAIEAPCWSYSDWIFEQDAHEPYRVYRQLLQVLQSSAPDRRLVLKSPAHFGMLEPLLHAVPEAKIVQTRRDPLAALPSMCSVLESWHRISSERVDRVQGGRRTFEHLARQCQRNLEQRSRLISPPIFDVRFEDLVGDPLQTARSIYEHFGFRTTPTVNERWAAWVAQGPPKQVGRHRYRLDDYGLDARDVTSRFAEYRARWGYA